MKSYRYNYSGYGDENENIFRTISVPITDPGIFLNLGILNEFYPNSCYYTELKDNKMSKIFLDKSLFDWEFYVYTKLLNYKIIPVISKVNENELVYNMTGLISLRHFINSSYVSNHLIINELLAFVLNLQLINFIHGNLTVDTIFINLNEINNKLKFYIMDFSCSLLKKTTITSSKKYIDIYSLYSSMNKILKDSDNYRNNDMINYLNIEIKSYIPNDEFEKML